MMRAADHPGTPPRATARTRRRPVLTAIPLAAALAAGIVAPATAHGATTLESIHFSPDVTTKFDSGTVVTPQRVVLDNLLGGFVFVFFSPLPPGTRVSAYAETADGSQLLSFDTAVVLPPGIAVRPGDVVRMTTLEPARGVVPTAFVLELDGAELGLPPGVTIDALSVYDDATLLLSFDTTVVLNGLTIEDEDIIRVGATSPSRFFDGSATRVPAELDLDAAHYLPSNKHLLVSFDGSGVIDGIAFDDEDVLEYDFGADSWALNVDGSALHEAWRPADLAALSAAVLQTATRTPTGTPMPTATSTPTRSASPPATTVASSGTATATQTAPPSATATPSGTATAVATAPATSTPLPTASVTAPPSATSTETIPASATPPSTVTPPPATPTATGGPPCTGDCDRNGVVTIDELVRAVNVALGNSLVSVCPPADRNEDGTITIEELVTAVTRLLLGCATSS